MITQNTIALLIVFLAAAISIYSIVKSLIFKKGSKCDGCSGCAFKNQTGTKTCETFQKNELQNLKFIPTKVKPLN